MEEIVANNTETTKKLGGITGKGFMPGVSGNPSGRPKNPLKEFQRQEFESMSREEKREYLADVDKYKRWTMAEGNPDTSTDITSDGKALVLPSVLIEKNEPSPDTGASS